MRKALLKTFAAFLSLVLVISLMSGCIYVGPTAATPSGNTNPVPDAGTPGATSGATVAPVLTPPVGTVAPRTGAPIQSGWNPPATAVAGQQLPDMITVVKVVRPSVVAINVDITSTGFFNQPVQQQGAASGWIIDANGIIVTNNHVVENASDITITLSDGRVFPATVVAADPVTDLAVCKIDATGLPVAKIGDSTSLQVGQQVAAIGNALGEGISMTGGWVSRLGASITDDSGQTLYGLIETDTAINPGNSGGPLVNMSGEVIGITNAKLVATGVELIGFAIATNSALPVIKDLINKGSVVYPYIGVSLQTVDQAVASQYKLAVNKGALVTQVGSNSPASQAGIRQGDVIVNINGTDISTVDDAVTAIRAGQIGQKMTITYYRGNNRQSADVTPVQRPA